MERARPLARNVSEILRIPVQPSYPAIKPRAGEIYLISWKDDSCRSEYKATKTIFPEHNTADCGVFVCIVSTSIVHRCCSFIVICSLFHGAE